MTTAAEPISRYRGTTREGEMEGYQEHQGYRRGSTDQETRSAGISAELVAIMDGLRG